MMPQLRRGQQQVSQAITVPAAIGGINAVTSLAEMRPDEAIFMVNILPEDFGCEVRDGFTEWANGWTGGAAKTVLPFEGNVSADDRLFVASPDGIFDVTTEGTTAPVEVVAFPSQGGQAGICHSVNFGNDAGDRFLLVTDGENGYYTWTQSTDTWEKIDTEITGADATLFNYIMIWKTRVWFIGRDSGLAYFTKTSNAFLGPVELFNWADQFRFGGPLVSLHNWTLDGGNGIDDYLVGISGSGDVVVYQGTDPTSKADFGLVGSWYVGELPFGNRVATEFSGELYILSVQGLMPLSKILRGAGMDDSQTYISNKISPYIRNVMDAVRGDFGWHIHIHPKQSLLFVNTPPRVGVRQLAFTLYFGHESWGIIGELEKSHTANWRGEVYWTDINRNKIMKQGGHVDAVFLDPQADGDPKAIDWEVLGAYNALGSPAQYKRVQFIRPMFIGEGGIPAFIVQAYYDYDISRLGTPPVFSSLPQPLWGNAGDYIYSVQSEGADLLILSIKDGTIQLTGVTTMDVTIGAHPLATLTWSVPNERYEGASVGIQAYLTGEIGQALATTIDPDTLVSSSYTLTPAEIGVDAGVKQALFDINNVPLPPATFLGSIIPTNIFGTNSPVTSEGSWNVNSWTGGIQANDNPRGANGLGRHVAVNIRGRTSDDVTLIAYDVIFDVGGLL